MKHQKIGLRVLCIAFFGIATLLTTPVALGDDAVLEIEGTCPGQVRISWSAAVPNRPAAVLFGPETGRTQIPYNQCQNTIIGLGGGVRWVATVFTNNNGGGSATGHANRNACGGFVQIVIRTQDLPCQVSNVVQVPE